MLNTKAINKLRRQFYLGVAIWITFINKEYVKEELRVANFVFFKMRTYIKYNLEKYKCIQLSNIPLLHDFIFHAINNITQL